MVNYEYSPLMKMMLAFMDINLMNPLKCNLGIKIVNLFSLISLVFYLIWYTSGLAYLWVDIYSISEANVMPSCIMALVKGTALVYYRKNLKNALMLLRDFWSPSGFPDHEERLMRIHRKAYKTVIILFGCAFVLSLPTMFTAMFQSDPRELPLKVYPICDYQTSPCYELIYTYLIFYCYYQFVPIHLYFEGLFIATIAYIYVGIEMIKIRLTAIDLQHLTEREALNILNTVISQHNLILRFVKEIRHVFTLPLLAFFALTGVTETVVLFMLTTDGIPPDTDHTLKYGSLIIIFSMEMLYYSVSATIVEEQIQSVGESVYNLNWHSKTYRKFRENLAFIIQRSQVDEGFTLGNMAKLNLETFVVTYRNIFSFYILLSETSKKGKDIS